MGSKEDNHCCPYFVVVGCADTKEHCHVACTGALDSTTITLSNDDAKERCLGDYEKCPMRPRGEDGGLVR